MSTAVSINKREITSEERKGRAAMSATLLVFSEVLLASHVPPNWPLKTAAIMVALAVSFSLIRKIVYLRSPVFFLVLTLFYAVVIWFMFQKPNEAPKPMGPAVTNPAGGLP